MFKNIIIILTVLLTALIFFGCSDRGTNIDRPDYTIRNGYQGVFTNDGGHLFPRYLGFSMFSSVRKVPGINYKIYFPPDYQVGGNRYPVLYLLSPFRGNEFYYLNRGLVAVADKMIAEGQIKPMIIVCLDGSAGYGGTFYGNSYAGGKYADAIGDKIGLWNEGSVVDYIDGIFETDTLRAARAISGFGMGGYGAMRIAVAHSENFSSVSAVSAPLDFDGAAGTGGFKPLFKELINILDTAGRGYVTRAEYKDMDTSYDKPLRTMLLAAACSFSPHYYDFSGIISYGSLSNPAVATDTLVLADTMTYLNPEAFIRFHLPFDTAGDAYEGPDSIWTKWMSNNVQSILQNHPDALDNMAVRMFTLSDDEYGFNTQTVDFADYLEGYLSGRGITRDLTPLEFDGYEGYPATSGQFVYDILPAILKFHSDNFPAQ